MGKKAPAIPAGYEAYDTGRKNYFLDERGMDGDDWSGSNRPVNEAQYNAYDETPAAPTYDDFGGLERAAPRARKNTTPLMGIRRIASPAAQPAAAQPAAPAAAAPKTTAGGGPQPTAPAQPVTAAAPKVQKVAPQAVVHSKSAAGAAGTTGQVFGTTGRRPFQRTSNALATADASTKKKKLGG
jgi:hypothetical protein